MKKENAKLTKMNIEQKLQRLSRDWFFEILSNEEDIYPDIIRQLPVRYVIKALSFIYNHNYEELHSLGLKCFIEQSTGERCDKVVKLNKVWRKMKEIEQDFK